MGSPTTCWCGEALSPDDPVLTEAADECDGSGEVACLCGGDQCVCHNHGSIPCGGCEACEPEDTDTYDEAWTDEEQDPHDRGVCDGPGVCRWCDTPPGSPTDLVLDEVLAERQRQDHQWGVQRHEDGDALRTIGELLETAARDALRRRAPTWSAILGEEVGEALRAEGPEQLRAELVQVAAVAVAWIEAIDAR